MLEFHNITASSLPFDQPCLVAPCTNALSRRGLLTATFAGNVPAYDIVATGSRGQTALVQVKAIAGPSWQFDIRTFVDVR